MCVLVALMLVTKGSSKSVSRRPRDGDERVEQECVSHRLHFGDKSMLVTKGLNNNVSLAIPVLVAKGSSKNVFRVAFTLVTNRARMGFS